jgi:hypothetical protein
VSSAMLKKSFTRQITMVTMDSFEITRWSTSPSHWPDKKQRKLKNASVLRVRISFDSEKRKYIFFKWNHKFPLEMLPL